MKNTINLLSFTAAPLTFWEKFYIWALTIGRYIIIITELIVLLCFFYKFKVDNDFAATKQDFNQNIKALQENYSQETTIVNYQTRIGAQSQIMGAQRKVYPVLSHILSLVPSGVTITSLQLSNNINADLQGAVSGLGNSELTTIQGMANAFRSDSAYSQVSLSNVNENAQSQSTTFELAIKIKQATP